jgi:hypothetical protein
MYWLFSKIKDFCTSVVELVNSYFTSNVVTKTEIYLAKTKELHENISSLISRHFENMEKNNLLFKDLLDTLIKGNTKQTEEIASVTKTLNKVLEKQSDFLIVVKTTFSDVVSVKDSIKQVLDGQNKLRIKYDADFGFLTDNIGDVILKLNEIQTLIGLTEPIPVDLVPLETQIEEISKNLKGISSTILQIPSETKVEIARLLAENSEQTKILVDIVNSTLV